MLSLEVLFSDLGVFQEARKYHLLDLLIRALLQRLPVLLGRGTLLQSELARHIESVVIHRGISDIDVWGLCDPEG